MSEVAKLKKALDFLCSHMPGASELAEIAQKGSLVMDSSHADAEEVFTDEAALPDTLMAAQRMLDSFKEKTLNNLEVGRLYERYIGYLYETDGWAVSFKGIIDGFDDLGRDLICIKADEHLVVQAKCWSRHNPVKENAVYQLYASTAHYRMQLRNALKQAYGRKKAREIMREKKIKSVICINNNLSEAAEDAANYFKMEVRQEKLSKTYPMIKCNISTDGKSRLYHLPFDPAYDSIVIGNMEGEKYVATVQEAEDAGFKRVGS